MLKPARIIACLPIFLIGCSTPVHQARNERPPDWGTVEEAKPPPVAPVVPAVPPPAPPLPAPPEEPLNTWVALDRWGQQHGFGASRRLSVAPVVAYGLPTTNGMLILTVGSLSASWDGLEFRLGFAPQQIDGQVFLHGLDLKKNLNPLLSGFRDVAKTNRVIVIDPGHGGSNTGARNVVDGRFEKELTLDWARRLEPLLAQSGWRVFLTRTNDLDVSLADRVAIAERQNADLFLSLHFNSAESGHDQAGLETYCLTPTGMSSTLTRDYDDNATQVFPNNSFDAQNLQLAFALHRVLRQAGGLADRSVRRARFMGVLRGQNRPAVLVEAGYLSNPFDAGRIVNPAYRQVLAEAIAGVLAGPAAVSHPPPAVALPRSDLPPLPSQTGPAAALPAPARNERER